MMTKYTHSLHVSASSDPHSRRDPQQLSRWTAELTASAAFVIGKSLDQPPVGWAFYLATP